MLPTARVLCVATLASAAWRPFVGCATGVDPVRNADVDAGPTREGASAGGAVVSSAGGAPAFGTGGASLATGGFAGQNDATSSGGAGGSGGAAGVSGSGAGGSSGGVVGGSGGAAGSGGSSGSSNGGGASGSSGSAGSVSVGCSDASAIPLPPGCTPKPPTQCGSAESACTGTPGCRAVLECVACNACQFANSCSACKSVIDQNGGVSGAARSAADNVLSCEGC